MPIPRNISTEKNRCHCLVGKNGVEKAKAALANAVESARSKLKQGETMRKKRQWESAIETFTAGLAVKGTHDEDLTAELKAALQGAEVSMSKRDMAR